MSGAPDPQYVVARSVLLDALDAQAVYLHTGAVELAVAAFTTDADLTLDPALLQPAPEIEAAMMAAGFYRGSEFEGDERERRQRQPSAGATYFRMLSITCAL